MGTSATHLVPPEILLYNLGSNVYLLLTFSGRFSDKFRSAHGYDFLGKIM
jgi:hypothetical protein